MAAKKEQIAIGGDLRQFKLTGVTETGEELGRGSFAVVLELRFRGLRCAGKKLHPQLSLGSSVSRTERDAVLRRFEAECELLASLRHPNIVQFLGVYLSSAAPDPPLPVLVMEFLPSTLAGCLNRQGALSGALGYGVLADVTTGLSYLHGCSPPVVHRDLSANNVLLARDMRAKISDLGVSRILGLSPAQVTQMSTCPGTPSYMPPEVLKHNPQYNESIDCFSLGVMMLHMLTGQWPIPCEPNRIDPQNLDTLIALSEVQRRQIYLDKLGDDHPLRDVILGCLSNAPSRRPGAEEVLQCLLALLPSSPVSSSFPLLQEKEEGEGKEWEIPQYSKGICMEKSPDITLAAESARLTITDLSTQRDGLRKQFEAKEKEVEVKQREFAAQIKSQKESIEAQENFLKVEISLREAAVASCHQELKSLQATKEEEMSFLKEKIVTLENNLSSKVSVVSGLKEQIGEYLSNVKQVSFRLQCDQHSTHAPERIYATTAVLLGEEVYVAHRTADTSGKHHVLSYSVSCDSWDSLPPLPQDLQAFGLGCYDNQLVTVGGISNKTTVVSDVYVFHASSQKWRKSIPSIPMKRYHSTVVGCAQGLAVIGGLDSSMYTVTTVYVYRRGKSEWQSTIPLPNTYSGLAAVTMGDMCYLAGGFSNPFTPSKSVFSISLSRLFSPFHQSQRIWTMLPDSPYFRSSPALLGGALIVVGGYTHLDDRRPMQTLIHAFSPQLQRWVEVGRLPAPRQRPVCITLGSGRVLVVGGKESELSVADSVWELLLEL